MAFSTKTQLLLFPPLLLF